MKKFSFIILALVVVLISACGKKDDRKVIGIAVSGYAAPFFKVVVAGAEEEAKKQNVKLKILDAQWNDQTQAGQIEALIAQKVDAICLIPCNSKAAIPSMKKIKKAGIPLIVLNTRHDPSVENIVETFVGASAEKEAAIAAQSIVDILGTKGGNVVVVEGAAGAHTAIYRTKGFEDVIKKHPNIKIIDKQNTGWDRANALKIMEDFLIKHKKIDAIYAHDDNLAMGIIQALKATNKKIPIVSISGNTEGYNAIRAGELVSTVSKPPEWEGKTAVDASVKILNGQKVEKWLHPPITNVTIKNVASFKGTW